jgi:hypothetical protein
MTAATKNKKKDNWPTTFRNTAAKIFPVSSAYQQHSCVAAAI